MLDHGMRATVNSDDPAYFPGYVNENLAAAQAEAGMSREEVLQLARNSFEVGWLDEAERADYLARLEAYAAGPTPA